MSTIETRDQTPPRPDTALAFVFAPGIAALLGGCAASIQNVMCAHPVDWMFVAMAPVVGGLAFAFAGYPTAAIIGIPVYLLLPERARSAFAVVVPLAGSIAAAPWFLAYALCRPGPGDPGLPSIIEIAFALGCVGGIAFLFIRRPRAPIGPGGGEPR